MKLIRPSYEIIEQGPGIQGIYEMIERCGKVSYKSVFKGGEFAKRFVEARTKEKHGAVLEFGTVYLKIAGGDPITESRQQGDDPTKTYYESKGENASYMDWNWTTFFYRRNPYSRVVNVNGVTYITTNYRVLVENNRLDDLKYLCEPTEYHEKRYTVKFIADIGVGREFLRHRVMSPTQESTRYCNYTSEKFDGECTFVIPPWISEEELAVGDNICFWDDDWVDMNRNKIVRYGPAELQADPIHIWLESLYSASIHYDMLISCGWRAEQARGVLPLATKAEFVLCGFEDAWVHFFRLRSDIAATGKPHPQSDELATPLRKEFIEKGYITEKDLEHEAFGWFDVAISDTNLKD